MEGPVSISISYEVPFQNTYILCTDIDTPLDQWFLYGLTPHRYLENMHRKFAFLCACPP